MYSDEYLRTIGIYIPSTLFEQFEEYLYDEAGVIDLDTYFDSQKTKIPRGDPAGEVLNTFIQNVNNNFDELYQSADFEAASNVDPDNFKVLQVASTPEESVRLKEHLNAAATIKNTDSRTTHTAIFTNAMESLLQK